VRGHRCRANPSGRVSRKLGAIHYARYPVHKTLADFDFDFQPTLDRRLVAELSTLRFVEQHRNVILLGPPERAAYYVSS
jgi:DNA replication protein DnaC